MTSTLLELINPEVLRSADSLHAQFQSNNPFPHLVLDDFLAPAFCDRLIAQFPGFDAGQAVNELGQIGRKAVFQNLNALGAAYRQFDALMRSHEFLHLTSRLTGISKLLYDPQYIGGGTHENLSGQDLDVHVDFNYHPATNLHRRLNLIVYLNREWEESWGGVLELHLDPRLPPGENRIKSVLPAANRCVLFETSERSWHGFSHIQIPPEKDGLSRRSIAVYFYTGSRPKPETAPSHGTFYVPRPLPAHIEPGRMLTEEDFLEIQTLLKRRDTQIEYLYRRELDFGRIIQSPSFRVSRLLTWPVRVLRRFLGSKPAA